MTTYRRAHGVEPGNASGQQAHDDPGGQKPRDNVSSVLVHILWLDLPLAAL
ncbi:hypothetical protein [Arthrobacter sp. PAMC25564]|uniref:hypothetical protein n=1 Tax=Arthrobacter sp. PAMC25564 TaxID=2565366 RepID=UPI0014474ADD|nr:hypothetical protein [Arthrobacter sp. PAMC25564]